MSPTTLLLLYCLAILGASLLGGLLPLFLKLGHTGTQVMMSAVAGFMLGVAVLHMLGHALIDATSTQTALLWLLGGFLVMFFTERFFAYHHHDLPTSPEDDAHAGHAHAHARAPAGAADGGSPLHWVGALAGMSIHSLISGTALAAAVASATLPDADGHAHAAAGGLAGFAVLLAILGHKPLDALTVVGLAHASGLERRKAHLLNLGFAVVEPVGVLLAWWGLSAFFEHSPGVLPAALAFSAGTFLCIALSDLLPEVQFHKHDRLKLSTALLLGLAAAWAIGLAEPDHAHGHGGHGPHAGHAPDAEQAAPARDAHHHDHEHGTDGHEHEHGHEHGHGH